MAGGFGRGDPPPEARTRIAWLLWCLQQGYVKAEDRDILDNWLDDDPATLHPDDAKLRPHLLAMADEVIAAVQTANTANCDNRGVSDA